MGLHVVRSTHVEKLVVALAEHLETHRPADPLETVPVIVGSRRMERWLRHQLATQTGVCAGMAFPLLGPALEGATEWVLDTPAGRGARRLWEPSAPPGASAWSTDELAFRLVRALRLRASDPAFAAVAQYLEHAPREATGAHAGPKCISHRELAFGRQIAAVLERLAYDRGAEALAWARAPEQAPQEHRWLACLLADLDAASPEAPAARYEALLAATKASTADARPLVLFGISTLGAGERARVEALARVLDVHLFLMTPAHAGVLERDDGERNPVLGSLGLAGSDLARWIASLEPRATVREAEGAAATADSDSLLHGFQHWIREGGTLKTAALSPTEEDGSLSLHAAFGPLRQVETLRDELLALFAADPALEPRDVLVMTPALDVYAPLVAAVFAQRPLAEPLPRAEGAPAQASPTTGQARSTGAHESTPRQAKLPTLPVTISDLGLRRTNSVAETLCAMLALCTERVTAPLLFELLSLEPVRRRLGVEVDALGEVHALIASSGMRWGLDAQDRARVGQPALDGNTLRFGVERLALGVLMHDDRADRVVAGTPEQPRPSAPLGIESAERVHLVGAIAAVVRALGWLRAEVGDGAERAFPTVARWAALLRELVDDYAPTSDAASWLRTDVLAAIGTLDAQTPVLGDTPVEPRALLRWLEGRFELSVRGDKAHGSTITMSGLEAGRSVPYRVIALLGMDDGAFPRGRALPTWDPFAPRSSGGPDAHASERAQDRRAVDRQLLLETLLSARDRLMIFWTGYDGRSGAALPAAVPVEEVLEVLTAVTRRTRPESVRVSPLQPWSAALFGGSPRSFDAGMAEAARLVADLASGTKTPQFVGLAASGEEELPVEPTPVHELDLSMLARNLAEPLRMLLSERLRLSLSESGDVLQDREPLELNALEAWRILDRLIRVVLAEEESQGALPDGERLVASLAERLVGEGALPLEAGGDAVLGDCAAKVLKAFESAASAGALVEAEALKVALTSGALLFGSAPRTRVSAGGERVFEWITASASSRAAPLLTAYVHMLASEAMGRPATAQLVSASDGKVTRLAGLGSREDAQRQLEALFALWQRARSRPLPLFVKTSSALGAALSALGDERGVEEQQAMTEALDAAWIGNEHTGGGERNDAWIRPFFPDFEPTESLDDLALPARDGFVWLAETVWAPVHRACARASEAAKAAAAAAKGGAR